VRRFFAAESSDKVTPLDRESRRELA
jgi:hypothetical protein